MAIPNMKHVIEAARDLYPEAWAKAHRDGDPAAWDFIILAARECAKSNDAQFTYGLNAKRGNKNDPSMDVIYVWAAQETDGVYDVIGAAGSSAATPAWNYLGPGENATSGYIDPFSVQPSKDYGSGTPKPPEPPKPVLPPYPGDQNFQKISAILESDYRAAGRPGLDGGCGTWIGRTSYDYLAGMAFEESVHKHRGEWRAALGLPPL